jgi:hypothetical protein
VVCALGEVKGNLSDCLPHLQGGTGALCDIKPQAREAESHPFSRYLFFFFFVALGFELRTSCMLGKHFSRYLLDAIIPAVGGLWWGHSGDTGVENVRGPQGGRV